MNTKETTIKEVNEVWRSPDGQTVLSNVVDEDGDRYSTKNGAYYSTLIGQKVPLQWNVSESKKVNPKTGKHYQNRDLFEGQGFTPKVAPTWKPKITIEQRLERIEKLLVDNGLLDK